MRYSCLKIAVSDFYVEIIGRYGVILKENISNSQGFKAAVWDVRPLCYHTAIVSAVFHIHF